MKQNIFIKRITQSFTSLLFFSIFVANAYSSSGLYYFHLSVKNKPIKIVQSPFPYVQIQVDSENKVFMSYRDIKARSINEEDIVTYKKYFGTDGVMKENYYSGGVASSEEKIESRFALWNGRWGESKYKQDHYQGGFLVFHQNNNNPFAHIIDGFIANSELVFILDDAIEDFSDSSGLLGEFKATIARLTDQNARGYSQAALDFTGNNIGFFIKDFAKLQRLTLLQDTYMHQLSYLGFNWGIETLLGRTVAHSSMLIPNENTIKAYEAMGYYPFHAKTKREFGVDKAEIDVIHMLKPVNPIQTRFSFGWDGNVLSVNVYMMSYFTTNKTFDVTVIKEEGAELIEIYRETHSIADLSPYTLSVELDDKYVGELLWLKLQDKDEILDPILLPMRVNAP